MLCDFNFNIETYNENSLKKIVELIFKVNDSSHKKCMAEYYIINPAKKSEYSYQKDQELNLSFHTYESSSNSKKLTKFPFAGDHEFVSSFCKSWLNDCNSENNVEQDLEKGWRIYSDENYDYSNIFHISPKLIQKENHNFSIFSDDFNYFKDFIKVLFDITDTKSALSYELVRNDKKSDFGRFDKKEVFDLVFYISKNEKYKFGLKQDKQENNLSDNIVKFPFQAKSEFISLFSYSWLSECEYGFSPDTDGSVQKGFKIIFDKNKIIISPEWAVYGK